MAFDQNIEADRIGGDFNLFSAFVRVPLLILEGVLGQQKRDDTKDRLDSKEHCEQSNSTEFPNKTTHSRRVVSFDDLPSGEPSSSSQGPLNGKLSRSVPSRTSLIDTTKTNGLKRNRVMSWSDESGLSLVEYSDESVRHEPSSPYENATSTIAPKPAMKKSSMRRSRSIRNNAVEEDRKRYIPNMSKEGKGLTMPVRPHGSREHGSPGGEFSPQWGWYTNLTPPDVMYGANSNKTRRQVIESGFHKTVRIPDGPENRPNDVFQSLQNSKTPVGWTSVPI